MHSWVEIWNQLRRDLELPCWSGLSKGAGFRQGWRVRAIGVCYNLITVLTATPSHAFPSPYSSLWLITYLESVWVTELGLDPQQEPNVDSSII